MSKILGIIPARSGSKRIKKKNTNHLCGKPLISWTIKSAMGSKKINDLIVSTDDEDIASISKSFGAEVPFLRPKNLANDDTSSFAVVRHTIKELIKQNRNYEYIILLQPTSPLRQTKHINQSIKLLHEKKANAIISLSKSSSNPLWSNTIPKSHSLKNFLKKDSLSKRSQEFPDFYSLNGAIFIAKIDELLKKKNFFLIDKTYAYIMNQKYSIDIDTMEDFFIAEAVMSKLINDK